MRQALLRALTIVAALPLLVLLACIIIAGACVRAGDRVARI